MGQTRMEPLLCFWKDNRLVVAMSRATAAVLPIRQTLCNDHHYTAFCTFLAPRWKFSNFHVLFCWSTTLSSNHRPSVECFNYQACGDHS